MTLQVPNTDGNAAAFRATPSSAARDALMRVLAGWFSGGDDCPVCGGWPVLDELQRGMIADELLAALRAVTEDVRGEQDLPILDGRDPLSRVEKVLL
jgi:hypothetical protein